MVACTITSLQDCRDVINTVNSVSQFTSTFPFTDLYSIDRFVSGGMSQTFNEV